MSAGYQPATFVATASGSISGNASGCSFSGTATARSNLNAFELTVRFNGGICLFGNGTLTGIAVYDSVDRALYAGALDASRTDGFLFVGNK